MQPSDGREACVRTRARCEQMREIAQGQFGYSATACQARARAVCFPVRIEAQDRTIERCFITGEECDRVFHALQPGPGSGCAIQTNDRPPTDGPM
jgi:hypothetical protein